MGEQLAATQPSDPRIAVVVLNWNKASETRNCFQHLRSVVAQGTMLICVDNGSDEKLELDSDVTCIRNTRNLGFTGGVNVGLAYALQHNADYVWLLNNDAEPMPNSLQHLIEAVRDDPLIGLASSVVLDSGNSDAIDFHGGLWDDFGEHRTTMNAQYQQWLRDSPHCIWLLGTALLVNRRLVEQIGLLDDGLFAYWEDYDFSRRSAQAGFKNRIVPESFVRHDCRRGIADEEARAPYYFYYMTRNEILVHRKHNSVAQGARLTYWAIRRHLRTITKLKRLPAQQSAIRRGIVDGLLGRTGQM